LGTLAKMFILLLAKTVWLVSKQTDQVNTSKNIVVFCTFAYTSALRCCHYQC